MRTPKQTLADIEKRKAAPLYYLYGDEPFKIGEFVEQTLGLLFGAGNGGRTAAAAAKPAASNDLTFCVDRIDGPTSTGSDVLEAVQSMGLFSGGAGGENRRLVIVRQAHLLKEVDPLADVAMSAPSNESPWGENLLLLCAESLDGRRKFHQWLKKKDLALEFKPARDAELAQWVQYLGKKTGGAVSSEAAELLAASSDGSLFALAQEIEKAWLYAGGTPGVAIGVEHVAGVAAGRASPELIELVRAILAGKKTRSLLLTEQLIGGTDDAIGLVGFLTWALKNTGQGRGGFVGDVAGGVARKRELASGLLELDLRLKSTGSEPRSLVEQFVIEQT